MSAAATVAPAAAPAASGAASTPARGSRAGWLVLPGLLLLVLGLFVPLGQVLWMSLNPPEPGLIAPVAEFTLANYARLLRSDFYLGIVFRTLWLSALTTAITAVLGMVLALSVWRARPAVKGLLLVVILAPLLASTGAAAGAEVEIALRPERIRLAACAADGQPGVTGLLTQAIYHGHASDYTVQLPDGQSLHVRQDSRSAPELAVGAQVRAHWPSAAVNILQPA